MQNADDLSQFDIIKLNVGGTIFSTRLTTLQKDPNSMLAAMFSGRFPLQKDEKGCFFLDRDPKPFRFVLNFLRNGDGNEISRDLFVPPESPNERKQLLQEAEYFQIQSLIDIMQSLIPYTESQEHVFTWKLKESNQLLSWEPGMCVCSPIFKHLGQKWYLKCYPNGRNESMRGTMALFLGAEYLGPEEWHIAFTLKSINNRTGVHHATEAVNGVINGETSNTGKEWGWKNFVSHRQLKDALVEDDTICLIVEGLRVIERIPWKIRSA
eukprot:gb/GECH01001132.1/.p1 GENE.gb/GECH01001132.1/~~gb/GECH01001132.1/.p1  ORF type:complete len:267 (+),score=68.82 gb/GECH01001132.1/:1-801(+)